MSPEWKNVHFTSPPENEKEVLLSPPKAKTVVEYLINEDIR